MASAIKKSTADILKEIERPQSTNIVNAEVVHGKTDAGTNPISIRLSAPLLERIDRLARAEHRKRGNMIQHILWQYVHSHDE